MMKMKQAVAVLANRIPTSAARVILASTLLCVAAVGPVSASTGSETLRGQVVCSDCWYEQKDRKATPYGSPSEMKCAVRCSKDDIPQALAVWAGDSVTLYLLEKGSITMADKDFLAYASRQVEISGTTRVDGGKHFLRVDTLTILEDQTRTAADVAAPEIGSAAPALSLRDLTGQTQSLASYTGKIVVLNFWATWCLPCRKEMPAFVKIQNEYAAWGVQVIGASADTADSEAQVVKFVREKKLSFPIWLGATSEQMLALGLGSELPGTVIIDRDGTIVARFKGMVKESELRKEVDALLEKHRLAGGGVAAARPATSSVPA